MTISRQITSKCKNIIGLTWCSLEAYRYLSALGPSGKFWSIGTNVFSDCIYNCKGLVDYITLK